MHRIFYFIYEVHPIVLGEIMSLVLHPDQIQSCCYKVMKMNYTEF